jgi:hypothetical protein
MLAQLKNFFTLYPDISTLGCQEKFIGNLPADTKKSAQKSGSF